MIKPLTRAYVSRTSVPILDRVDIDIFILRYFAHCMECTFCHDSCCAYGCDTDVGNVARILKHADGLEEYIGVPRAHWYEEEVNADPEYPSGAMQRTAVVDGACVFRNRKGRGCLLHSYCLDKGMDVHELKPLVATLFPVTFQGGLLHPPLEIRDGSLICLNNGPTLYRSARGELEYFFGRGLVEELDALEAEFLSAGASRARRVFPLPLLEGK